MWRLFWCCQACQRKKEKASFFRYRILAAAPLLPADTNGTLPLSDLVLKSKPNTYMKLKLIRTRNSITSGLIGQELEKSGASTPIGKVWFDSWLRLRIQCHAAQQTCSVEHAAETRILLYSASCQLIDHVIFFSTRPGRDWRRCWRLPRASQKAVSLERTILSATLFRLLVETASTCWQWGRYLTSFTSPQSYNSVFILIIIYY